MKVNGNPKQVQASSAGETTPRFPLTSTNEDSYQTRIQATTLPRLSNPPSRSTRPCFGKHCTTFGASASTASLALDYCATRVRNTTTTPPTPESHPRIPSKTAASNCIEHAVLISIRNRATVAVASAAMAVAINDRTSEFRHIVTAARRRQAAKPGSQRLLSDAQRGASAAGAAQPRRSEFARNAADIGRGISATMGKLEKLAQLAKKRSLFDDNPVEVNELTFIIKQDLSRMNEDIRNLQTLSKRLHPKPDQEGENNKNILLLLQGKLGDVSANFKDVLEIRTKNIQASRSRTEAFVSNVGQHAHASLPPSASPLYGTPSRGTPAPATDLISLNPMGGDQQLQLQMMEEGQNTYIHQRGQAIEAIESTINELGSM